MHTYLFYKNSNKAQENVADIMYQLVKNEKEEHYFTGKKDEGLDDESRSTLLKKIEKEINSSDIIPLVFCSSGRCTDTTLHSSNICCRGVC